MRRFTLRSLLLLVASCAIAATAAHYLIRPDPMMRITTHAEWDVAIKRRNCVLFVDGDWNIDIVAFRRPFAKFAWWCYADATARAITMKIDSDDTSNDVWSICDTLWSSNEIHPGGLKNFGGAGRVVWLKNGNVVDYAWCMELMQRNEVETIALLQKRTRKAFD